MAIPQNVEDTFADIARYAKIGELCLVEVTEKATGKAAYIICLHILDPADPEPHHLYPVARILEGEPCREFNPPENRSARSPDETKLN